MSAISYEVTEAGICRIIFTDALNRNAVNHKFSEAFARATRQAATDPAIRVIEVTAQGPFFSVGGDLQEFVSEADRVRDHVMALTDLVHTGVRHLCQAAAPVVIGLKGMAAGGGFSFLLSGDVVIATRSARLNSGYTKSGLTPDCGATWLLPRLVGHLRAFEIMALNATMTADEAQALGLVTTVVEDDAFEAALSVMTEKLAAMPAGVLGQLKILLRESSGRALETHLDREAEAISTRTALPDTIDRLRKFLKK
jgi:2-(1,2-epoxy-1,2-dihydrophenyl)acetyl-CoA isomerase